MIIAFTGAQGSGKSTLLEAFLTNPQYSYFARSSNPQRTLLKYASDFKINQDTDFLSQISITSIYSNELIKAHENNIDYITDRSLIDTFAYMYASDNISIEHKHYIEDTFKSIVKLYGVIFYTPIEFTPPEDGVRVIDDEYRHLIDTYIQRFLNEHYPNYITLTGTVEERMKVVLETINTIEIKDKEQK